MPSELIPVGLSFVCVLVLTPLMRALAQRIGCVDRSEKGSRGEQSVSLLGGVAIVIGVGLVCWWHGPSEPGFRVILGATGFLAAVGLLDDAFPLKPYQKLAAQLAAAAAMIYIGYALPWTGSAILNIVLTVVWLVGITNALNLLDNMDGLAGGIAAIAACFLGFNFAVNGQTSEAVVLFALAAGLLAFLVYNFNPASIYMGDCGSMAVGFFLASAALLAATGGRSRSLLSVLAVPLLVLLIPIFDTVLVTIMRPLAGKAISQGWNDHTSHRLVALGLSERKAVLLLYALAAASGLASLLVRNLTFDVGLAILASFVIGLALLGIQLADVKIFSEAELEAARKRPLVALLFALSFKRRIIEMALDVMLFVLSYYLACAFLYGTGETNPAWGSFRQVVALLVPVRLTVFLWMGVYRGIWKYVSFEDAIRYAQAVAIGSVLTAFIVLIVRPIAVSGVLFVLDGLLTIVFIAGSRVTFLVCGRMLPQPASEDAKRVLIYGAGEAGLLALRLLQSDSDRTYEVVGFLDDDRLKEGMRIRGLPVYHPDHTLAGRIRERGIELLVVSSETIADERVYFVLDLCPERELAAVRLRVDLEVVRRQPMMAAG